MALGYCTYCDTLRNIRPGPQQWGTRMCAWYPVAHWINVHQTCENIVFFTGLDKNEYPTAVTCVKCGPVSVTETLSIRCPGEKKSL